MTLLPCDFKIDAWCAIHAMLAPGLPVVSNACTVLEGGGFRQVARFASWRGPWAREHIPLPPFPEYAVFTRGAHA